eukprot:2471043-Prymnesium_polylepis.1
MGRTDCQGTGTTGKMPRASSTKALGLMRSKRRACIRNCGGCSTTMQSWAKPHPGPEGWSPL